MALRGNLEVVMHDRLSGWAWNPDHPQEAVVIRVLADGELITRSVANVYREDLHAAGINDGRHAFDLTDASFKPPFGSTLISVVDEATGEELPNSPIRLAAPLDLNGPARTAMTALFDSPGSEEDLRERAEFAGREAERLLQRLSDRRSRRVGRAAQRARKWRWRPEDGPEPERIRRGRW